MFQPSHVGDAQGAQIENRAGAIGDYVGARAALDEAGVDGDAPTQVVPPLNALELPGEFVDRIDAFLRSEARMRGTRRLTLVPSLSVSTNSATGTGLSEAVYLGFAIWRNEYNK